MRLRRLVIRISTNIGPYGATIDFPDGLVVIWADNSMGKSTCLKSMMWALGLEAMITTSQSDPPVTPVMKAGFQNEDGEVAVVVESEVFLEIENSSAERVVIHRAVKGTRDTHLVTVVRGPALTQTERAHLFPRGDYYVSRPGGASAEAGFHSFLSEFLGWKIPTVSTFDGRKSPLYLQAIFPYVLVEQTKGWSNIQPNMPTQFRIRDVHKRVVEFILKMDANRIAARRIELSNEKDALTLRWSALVANAEAAAGRVNARVESLPHLPTAEWPPVLLPTLLVPEGDGWQSLDDAISINGARLDQIATTELPRAAEVVSSATEELTEAQARLRQREVWLERLYALVEEEKAEYNAVQERLRFIEEDLRRNNDVKVLQTLGSVTASLAPDTCPTCHQPLRDSLLPHDSHLGVMSIDDNISFVKDQRHTFEYLSNSLRRAVVLREGQVLGAREEIQSLRARIRALRQTLVADGRTTSAAAVREQLELEDVLQKHISVRDDVVQMFSEFGELSRAWLLLKWETETLPKEDTSIDDVGKLERLSDIFRAELSEFGFASFKPETLTISKDTYRPEHDGFDLPTNISASDFIRVIWAYLHGLLELSRCFDTNHPGLLVMDEPKQQSTKSLSFGELIRRASTAKAHGQQVVLVTSEDRDQLVATLKDVPHTLLTFEGRIIKKLQQP
jgi:hypothetical protein